MYVKPPSSLDAIHMVAEPFQMPDEEAFCLLVRLMHSYDLRGHFLPEMPKLQLRLVRVVFLFAELGTDELGTALSSK